jgi:hypothetical protein
MAIPGSPATRQRIRARPHATTTPAWRSFQGTVYLPRGPTQTPLYQAVQHHLETFLARSSESEWTEARTGQNRSLLDRPQRPPGTLIVRRGRVVGSEEQLAVVGLLSGVVTAPTDPFYLAAGVHFAQEAYLETDDGHITIRMQVLLILVPLTCIDVRQLCFPSSLKFWATRCGVNASKAGLRRACKGITATVGW